MEFKYFHFYIRHSNSIVITELLFSNLKKFEIKSLKKGGLSFKYIDELMCMLFIFICWWMMLHSGWSFMDSKAKNKEQTPIDWNRKWRKKTAGHQARLSVIEEPPTKKFKTILSRTFWNVNRKILCKNTFIMILDIKF